MTSVYDFRLNCLKKAIFSRHFEECVFRLVKEKYITCPVYLSAGQELIAASLSELEEIKGLNPLLFVQHRNHSTYLSFGGDPYGLARELLGNNDGSSGGKGGCASVHCKDINLYGHDGLLGSQVPIATGACFSSNKPTICFMGDASVEEDYVLSSFGWASLKNLPILYVVEDNNLSILTEKKVRRNWNICSVAQGFGIESQDINDNPLDFLYLLKKDKIFKSPMLINVNTKRLWWHVGAGKDTADANDDRLEQELKHLPVEIKEKLIEDIHYEVESIWQSAMSYP